jgi:TonB family protein
MSPAIRAIPSRGTTAGLLFLLAATGASALEEPKPGAAGGPLRVGAGVSRPEFISHSSPMYTDLARTTGLTGMVIVESVIDESGSVTNVKVLKGLPLGLSRAAVESVSTWKFKPAYYEGRPVKVYYVLTVNFRVEGDTWLQAQVKKLLSKEPGLADEVRGKSRPEARELLARWQGGRLDPALFPYFLFGIWSEEGRFQEGLQELLSYRGRERYAVLWHAGAAAWNQLYGDRNLTGMSRAELLELALQLETQALQEQADGFEALVFKALLLQEKISITADPSAWSALFQQVDQLRRRTIELRPETAKEGLIPEQLELEGTRAAVAVPSHG